MRIFEHRSTDGTDAFPAILTMSAIPSFSRVSDEMIMRAGRFEVIFTPDDVTSAGSAFRKEHLMIRRLRGFVALLLDHVAGPPGWQVNVMATTGLPGVDRIYLFRRPPGSPPARRIKARRAVIDAALESTPTAEALQGWIRGADDPAPPSPRTLR